MPSKIDPSDKLILALDGMDREDILLTINKIPELSWVKVGLELFVKSGPSILCELRNLGLHIFLDLKFHDIPNTMANACKAAAENGVELITVHSCAGYTALIKSKKYAEIGAKQSGLPSPTLLAVTVLTSWEQKQFSEELSIDQLIKKRVELLAELTYKAGLGGCICSPAEVKSLRKKYSEPFQLITPGIRFKGSNLQDQVRVSTPSEALRNGASKLVIGRPVTQASDPREAFLKFCEDIKRT